MRRVCIVPTFSELSVESQYAIESVDAAAPRCRAAMLLAVGLYAVFGVLDYLLNEPDAWVFSAIRAAVCTGLLAGWARSRAKNWASIGERFVAGTVVVAASGIAVMIVIADQDLTRTTFFAGNLLIMIFASGFGLLRTRLAIWSISAAGAATLLGQSLAAVNAAMLITSVFFVAAAVLVGIAGAYLLDVAHRDAWQAERTIRQQRDTIDRERDRADALLTNILPSAIAERLKAGERPIADGFADVTVLFADLQSFTQLSARLAPLRLVEVLDSVFRLFDQAAERHGVQKVKTIGDAYMAVVGLPEHDPRHAATMVAFAEDLIDAVAEASVAFGEELVLRIGINSGPVVAGVIGEQRIIYDLWGDTVNVASRIEGAAKPSHIAISESTLRLLSAPTRFHPTVVDLKGKGPTPIFQLCPVKAA